jgi:hypothetical protein
MHPFKHQAQKSGKSKMGAMGGTHSGRVENIANMSRKGPASGYKNVDSSHSDTMEIMDRPCAMARGGKTKHSSKHKSPIARGLPPATPSPDDMAAMQAGAGMPSPSPAPAPPMPGGPPGMPMQKRGGRIKRAAGGRIPDAGQGTGIARMEQAGIKRKSK